MTNKEYGIIVSRNLRRLLYDSEKSQADLARDLGLPKTTISGWLNGARIPRMETIDRLCDYFGVSRSDLMDGKNGYYEKSKRREGDPVIVEIIDHLRPDSRAALLEYARYLLEKDSKK